MNLKLPRYLTLEEFKRFYPNINVSEYRDDLVYASPRIITHDIMINHLDYLKEQDKVARKTLEKYGRYEAMPISEIFDPEELLKIIV